MMKRCAFLSMASLDAFECYDHLLFEPLADLGWDAEEVPWRNASIDWDMYEAVIIRSPWDYQDDPARFMNVLQSIDQSTARLENSLEIVRWNLDKSYLKEMQQNGIPIVETQWEDSLNAQIIQQLRDSFGNNDFIIKPLISANADHTYHLNAESAAQQKDTLIKVFKERPLMIQPFMQNIVSEGEFSLFYFAGNYSHAILKTPKKGDFRVQEEHGGILKSIHPEPSLKALGDETMQKLPEVPLYARADYVRTRPNEFALMELELIEPSLYFNMDPESPRRFAETFARWMQVTH